MAVRIEPGLHREIARYGGGDVTACMNCGACTATCPLSAETGGFPRRIIHLLQVGHRDRLRASLEPWLCYYCGECSETCPRDANPADTMMAARRFLTAEYDWTGIGKRLYTHPALQLAAAVGLGLLVAVLFALLHGPIVTDRVALNSFAPVEWIERADWAMAAVLAALLLSNVFRMFRFVMRPADGGGARIPLRLLVTEARTFVVHFVTQLRWRTCPTGRTRWLKHLLLVSGYVTMMVLVEVFLRAFQTDRVVPVWHPTRLFGYYATAVLLYAAGDFLLGRLRKRDWIHRHSEPSDWVFVGLLFLVALTGILVHIARVSGFPVLTYDLYVVHLAVVTPFLVLQVPFGKWSHMFYRPFAIYLEAVRTKLQAAAAAPLERAA
ncbi:MAG TPA: 4Fe-4S dicluster domain-containing protein [Gemmatimonadales bacterium]|nr:4Fe-4S dicluster domain-containing protein [Gemmatimonadales bacterium]